VTSSPGLPHASGDAVAIVPATGAGIEAMRALQLDLTVARLLSIGTNVAVGILALGVAAMAISGRSPLEVPFPALDLSRIPADLVAVRPEGFLWLGLLAVIVTPTSRVVASLIGFARGDERTMLLISLAILGVIGASVLISVVLR
jgi:uncharacterized membrane protein